MLLDEDDIDTAPLTVPEGRGACHRYLELQPGERGVIAFAPDAGARSPVLFVWKKGCDETVIVGIEFGGGGAAEVEWSIDDFGRGRAMDGDVDGSKPLKITIANRGTVLTTIWARLDYLKE